MPLNIDKEVAAMKRMTVGELQSKYAEVYGESTNGRHKQWLIKRIAWRMQANEYGGLSDRALTRAREIANTSDLRTTPPGEDAAPPAKRIPGRAQLHPPAGDDRLPAVGLTIERVYKGVTYEVIVREGGFEFEGEFYKSLTAIAGVITGSHWNGYRFFKLDRKETSR
ncbi:DUF2924 domain-containing protein [Crateriforma conspicua]|uniref:DUF2924 domain-containing protein n=1 Tax=Crateriforma conspicua TaxID=2527996 RepID=UPI00118845C0|nr:DUF2924 domain-containing protein [Crateriforma conspicua]QDV62642.1 hypothetical protein Mal65_17760 [Crateriforma conspicua]